MKQLNGFVDYQHFKMEDISVLKNLLRPNDWTVKLDLKDAYFCVPMHEDFRKHLRFKWRSSTMEFNCLPFGYGPAPRKFTKIFRPFVAFLRKRGMCLIIYIDDIIILNQNQQDLIKHSPVFGVCDKLREITSGTNSEVGISRYVGRLCD